MEKEYEIHTWSKEQDKTNEAGKPENLEWEIQCRNIRLQYWNNKQGHKNFIINKFFKTKDNDYKNYNQSFFKPELDALIQVLKSYEKN